jgi:hypothetical protein
LWTAVSPKLPTLWAQSATRKLLLEPSLTDPFLISVVFQEVVSTNQHLVSNYLIASLEAGGQFPLVAWVFETLTAGMLKTITVHPSFSQRDTVLGFTALFKG